MRACAIESCERIAESRGWCHLHYERWRKHGDPLYLVNRPDDWVNPLVCICAEPLADPAIQFGQCRKCFRKPLALFGVKP